MKVFYNGVIAFDAKWAAAKSEKDFVEHEKHHGLPVAQLKEAHKLCKKAVSDPSEPAEPAEPTEPSQPAS